MSWWSLLLINPPHEDEKLSWPCWRFTHINGQPSAAGPVQTSESPPFRDWRSTTEPPNQLPVQVHYRFTCYLFVVLSLSLSLYLYLSMCVCVCSSRCVQGSQRQDADVRRCANHPTYPHHRHSIQPLQHPPRPGLQRARSLLRLGIVQVRPLGRQDGRSGLRTGAPASVFVLRQHCSHC